MRSILEGSVDRLLADAVDPALITAAEAGVWPSDLWQAIEDNGLIGATVPEEQGGAGASWGDAFAIVRAAGRHAVPLPLADALLARWLLARVGLDAPDGLLLPAHGPDLRLQKGRLSGRLPAVPWGRHADHLLVIAGGGVHLVRQADLSVMPGMNIAREPRDVVTLNAVRPVASAALAGLPADAVLAGGALLRSAQIAGGLQQVLARCLTYAGERKQFGRAIGAFQAVQQQIAVLAEQVAAATMAADAAFTATGPHLPVFAIASAKVCAGEAAGQGAAIAHAVHGAIGFTHEHTLHISTRRLWSWRSEYGSHRLWAEWIGRQACAGSGGALWPALTAGGFQAVAGL